MCGAPDREPESSVKRKENKGREGNGSTLGALDILSAAQYPSLKWKNTMNEISIRLE